MRRTSRAAGILIRLACRRLGGEDGAILELEVALAVFCRLVAAGETNNMISTRLSISERTVERHVSNIFTKVTVSTRAAATSISWFGPSRVNASTHSGASRTP